MLAGVVGLQAQSIVQEFYVPMPEAQLRDSYLKVAPNTGTTSDSVISIVVAIAGTRLVYDHWEDGYEVDLNHPTQATTQTWGDGKDANGKPPGYATDPAMFDYGSVVALRNLVPLPRNAGTILFDGRDRLGASQAVTMSRAAWFTTPGPLLADAVAVVSTVDWGTSFVMPVGENVVFPTPATASMFEHCGLFVMAANDGTQVQIDSNANGVTDYAFTLNRGESYLLNGGMLSGAAVTATKPVQVVIDAGDVGANYESRWYAVPPLEQWASEYYSPVGTASDGDDTYIFLYNPGPSDLTINYQTRTGSGVFAIPTSQRSYRFLMPQDSGARFSSAGGEPFYAVGAVGAEPTANNVHDWGFSLVPTFNLTTELVVGWGPGSRDGSQNGNPVWVTAVRATRIYVDYDGDHAGPNSDPRGGKYDLALDVAPLQVSRIYEADKDQTGTRLYTLDGTLITAAWGQDPAVAGPAEPYLDLGTTVPNFPKPVLRKLYEIYQDNGLPGLSANDVLEYTVILENKGLVALSAVTVNDTLPAGVSYVAGSTTRDGQPVPDAGGTPFPLDESGLVVPIILRGGDSVIRYRVNVLVAGTHINLAYATPPGVDAVNIVTVPGTLPANCSLAFTTSGGAATDYNPGDGLYVTLTDADANTSASSLETAVVVIQNASNGDLETLELTETGLNTGVFRNAVPLPSSTTAGGLQLDGVVLALSGQTLSVAYTDPVFGDTCNDTAAILTPSNGKVLYLDADAADGDTTGDLDRVDPVATGDATTSQTSSLAGGGSATITVVGAAASSTSTQTASSHSFSYNSGTTGANRILMVGISYRNNDSETVSSITYGGQPLTLVGTAEYASGTPDGRIYIYRLLNPPTGANTLAVTWNSALNNFAVVGAVTYSGVNQTTPTGTFASAGAASGTPAVSVNSATGQLVFGVVGGRTTSAYTVTGGGTQLWSVLASSGQTAGAAQSAAGATTVNLTWNGSSAEWVAGGVSLVPASSSAGTAVFTQTPVFCAPFTMPAGASLSVRNYVSVPTGSLTGNPAVTATLRQGGATFATLANPTATLVSGGTETVTHAATTSSSSASTSSLTFSHTPGTGNNRLLLVAVGVGATTPTGDPPTITAATFGGTPLTLVTSRVSGSGGTGDDTISYLYRLVSPGSGAANVVISLSGAGSIVAGASTYTGVDPTTPLGTAVVASGSGGTASVTVSAATGQLVFGTVSWDEQPTITVPGDQTPRWNITGGASGAVSGAASTEPGATSVTHSYTSNNTQDWALIAVPIRPASSAAAYRLDWATTLGSSVNVPAGDAVSLTVQNNSGTAFSVLYDSATYPSMISLPATTVISVDSVGVFDAPYPGGNPAPTPPNGQTLYVRAVVSDPFGAADITSLPLTIDGPGTLDDLSTTLTDAQVVASDSCSKTYQYVWFTGATPGPYTITATGREGFENTVTSQRSTTVTLSPLDLGTPCESAFTSTLGGSTTTTYAENATVYLRVTDIDQNALPAVVETVAVTVTGSSGDAESLNLTETGASTGVFVGSIASTTSGTAPGGVNPNNGALYAPAGSTLSLNYLDPNDPTDPCSSTALVPLGDPQASAVAITKTLLTPADGQIMVGESAQYGVRVINTGNVALNTVRVDDTFPAAHLEYLSATPAPDTSGTGVLTWNNLGPLAPGQRVDLVVQFKGLASAAPAVNSALVTTNGVAGPSSAANVIVTEPKITLAKTRLTPASGPVNKGDPQTFRLVVQNTGDTAIATLPLEDTFSGACFEYASATLTPDSVGAGSLVWNDLTGTGDLAVGQSITIEVTLEVLGGCNPAENLADVRYAVDEHGDPVPPSSSTASLETRAASITGHVFEDDGVAGFGGDTPLAGVNVRLYRPDYGPDGLADTADDDDPVGLVTTDATGYYEFLNLGLGSYVVKETDPVGYLSVDDTEGANTDNTIAVEVLDFVAYADNDFLDDLIDPLTYGSITGQVRNDTDADGDLADPEAGIGGVTIYLYTDPDGDGDPSDGVLFQTTTTATSGAVGSYSFQYVPPGAYVVLELDPTGYVSTGDKINPNDNRIAVTVPGGGTSSANDFLDTQNLAVLGTLGNLVWHDLNNDGLHDADGADNIPGNADDETGLGDVIVELYHSSQTPGVDLPYLVTTTSAGGAYTFANLPAGSYVAYLPAANFAPGGALRNVPLSSATTDPGDNGEDNDDNGLQAAIGQPVTSPVINVAAGETDLTLDFGFAGLATVGNQIWLDANNDGLLNPGESGVNGVIVQLFEQGKVPGTDAPFATTTTATVGADAGVYGFTALPPGSYFLYLPAENFAPGGALEPTPFSSSITDNDDNGQDNDDNGTQTAGGQPVTSPPIALGSGETEASLDFGFYGNASIGNTLWEDHNNNGRVDAGEPGFVGVAVELWRDLDGDAVFEPSGDDAQTPLSTATGAGGRYGFADLTPAQYFVVVPAPPANHPLSSTHTTATDNGVDNDDNGLQPGGPGTLTHSPAIALASRESDTTIDFGFVDPGIGNLVWSDADNDGVVDPGEPGIASVVVELYDASNVKVAETTTDADGYYLFQVLPPASYYVRIPAINFQPGGALAGHLTPSAVVVNLDNRIDDDNNGTQTAGPGSAVTGPLIELVAGAEPVDSGAETGRGNALDNVDDADSDLTVDFGFWPNPPTAVVLDYFHATAGAGGVGLRWRTLVEIETVGFALERSTAAGRWSRIGGGLVAAEGQDRQPHTYSVLDEGSTPAAGLKYRLIEVDVHGRESVLAEAAVASAAVTISRTDRGPGLALRGAPGAEVIVESTTDLGREPWRAVRTFRLDGHGEGAVALDAVAEETARFFRVLLP